MTRLDDLSALRISLLDRLEQCSSDQNYATMARVLVDVVKQIEELSTDSGPKTETGLSDFERRLRERESGAKASRRAGES